MVKDRIKDPEIAEELAYFVQHRIDRAGTDGDPHVKAVFNEQAKVVMALVTEGHISFQVLDHIQEYADGIAHIS